MMNVLLFFFKQREQRMHGRDNPFS